jgi:hypothetical protein
MLSKLIAVMVILASLSNGCTKSLRFDMGEAKSKPQPHDMHCINLNHNSGLIYHLIRCENSEVICHVSKGYKSGGLSCFKKGKK